MAIDLTIAKAHLNITQDDDNTLITRLISVAQDYLAAQLGFAIDDTGQFPDGTPADLENAQLMLVGHWYENREASIVGVSSMMVPLGVREIVANYRKYTFGVSDA